MSHDDEAAATPRGARQRGHSPLERPSLFAEFDQDHVEDIEPQRVRLLSTLESQRGRSRRPRHKRVASGTSSAWTTRALVVVMGMGMLVVLLSFIEVLRRPPPAFVSPTTPTMPATPTATTTPKAPPPIDIQAAEIIDTAPPAAPALSATPATPAPPAAAPPPTATLLATAAADVARLNAEPTGRKAPREAERRESRESRPRSDDVALLEAMFTHTGQTNQTSQTGSLRNTPAANRKTAGPSSASTRASDAAPTGTAASATEALRQCGAASSADAAVCRARVCVQHPTTPACHVSER